MSRAKEYLGDGVYIDLGPSGDLVLTTEDGYRATNTIVLEPGVTMELLRYVARFATPDGRRNCQAIFVEKH